MKIKDLLEESFKTAKSKDSEKIKFFIRKAEVAKETLNRCGERLTRQAEEYFADARQIDLMIDFIQLKGSQDGADGD